MIEFGLCKFMFEQDFQNKTGNKPLFKAKF